jgi:hypothetical protein
MCIIAQMFKPVNIHGNRFFASIIAAAIPPALRSIRRSAKVSSKDDFWEAAFEGECGRPSKYTIEMEGREVGKVLLFKGTTSLGPQGGGVYDWIGRANEKEFSGFFTSGHSTGSFALKTCD